MRSRWLSALAVLAASGVGVIWLLLPGEADRLRKQKEELLLEKAELERAIARLTGEERVAEVHVLDGAPPDADVSWRTNSPQIVTTIEFIELDRQRHPLTARQFTIRGEVVFLDALVIKFDPDLVAAGDPLRGKSLALFRRVYGEYQNPAEGFPVDRTGDVPNLFRIAPEPNKFEKQLWERFWHYAMNPAEAARQGVRVVQGEAVYVPMRKGQVWTVTLQNGGGLDIRLHRVSPATAPAEA